MYKTFSVLLETYEKPRTGDQQLLISSLKSKKLKHANNEINKLSEVIGPNIYRTDIPETLNTIAAQRTTIKVVVSESPKEIRKWCICPLSGENGEEPFFSLRSITINVS